MVKVAVIRVVPATAMLVTDTPAPRTTTVAPARNWDPPRVTETLVPCTPLLGAIELSTGGAGGAVTVTVAVPTAEGEAALAACTVTIAPVGGTAGAVYRPLGFTRPTVVFPPGAPLTLQFTSWVVALVTVAVNCFVAPLATVAVDGLTVT